MVSRILVERINALGVATDRKLLFQPIPSTPSPGLGWRGFNDTALIGKWHLGQPNFYHPTKFGFKYFMGHRHGGWLNNDPVMEKGRTDQGFTVLHHECLLVEALALKPSTLLVAFCPPDIRGAPAQAELGSRH